MKTLTEKGMMGHPVYCTVWLNCGCQPKLNGYVMLCPRTLCVCDIQSTERLTTRRSLVTKMMRRLPALSLTSVTNATLSGFLDGQIRFRSRDIVGKSQRRADRQVCASVLRRRQSKSTLRVCVCVVDYSANHLINIIDVIAIFHAPPGPVKAISLPPLRVLERALSFVASQAKARQKQWLIPPWLKNTSSRSE